MESVSKGSFSIDLETTHLKGFAAFVLDDVLLHLKDGQSPAEFTLNLTPQGYRALRGLINENYDGKFALSETAITKIKVKSFTLPVFKKNEFSVSYWLAEMDALVSVDQIVGVNNNTKQKLTLTNLHGQLKK